MLGNMRDHTKLRAFEVTDQLAVLVYEHSRDFPRSELAHRLGFLSDESCAAVKLQHRRLRLAIGTLGG